MTTKDNEGAMRNMGKMTITDIAEKCGVSIKTVSRVLNESPDVSDATRQKVLAAMKESGYQANPFARGLKGSKTNIIIVFIDRHQEEHLSLWHTIILKYLFQYAKKSSLKIVVSPSNSENYLEDETDGFYLLSSRIADGAILLENVHQDKRLVYLEEQGIPYVVFGEPEGDGIHAVSLDNYDVGFKGGRFLASRDYKNVTFLLGEERFLSNQRRIKGFKDGVEGSGMTSEIISGIDTIEKAYQKTLVTLDKMKAKAFFVSGDERAIGVYKAINERKLRIPEDIGVLGIDNIPLGKYLYPPMSTVNQDFELLAAECIRKLTMLLSGKPQNGESRKTLIPASIIEREST